MKDLKLLAARFLPEAEDFLKKLAAINSHSLNRDGVEQNASLICSRFADFKWTEHRVVSPTKGAGRHLLLDSNHHGPVIFLISHLDTVFTAEEQIAAKDSMKLDGSRLLGPGMIDNKGGTAMLWMILRILREAHPETFRAIRWVAAWNATEELLTPDFAAACLAFQPAPIAALVFESDNASEPGKAEIVTWRCGIARYRLFCNGRGAHAGNGHENGRNAIIGLAAAIQDISQWTDYARNTVVNVGIIRGGESTNRVPDQAEAAFEIRYRDSEHLAALEARLEKLTPQQGCSLRVEKEKEIEPLEPHSKSKWLETAWREAGAALDMTATIGGRRGLSDANFFSRHCPTLDGLGPRGGNAHGIERLGNRVHITEFLERESIVPKAALTAYALSSIAKTIL